MIEFKLSEDVNLPKYQTENAAGFDVTANSILAIYKGGRKIEGEKLEKAKEGFKKRGIKLRPFERIIFGTGLTVASMDNNIEMQVRSRSGKAAKEGLIVINAPGTIDPDYRGEIGVIIYNSSQFLSENINRHDRIAQIVVSKFETPQISENYNIEETFRGDGGFGSTGNK